MKVGPKVVEVEVAAVDDETLLQMFLGRDGDRMRAPVLASGDTIFAGSDENQFRAMLRR